MRFAPGDFLQQHAAMGDAVVAKAFQGVAVDWFAADHDGDGGEGS